MKASQCKHISSLSFSWMILGMHRYFIKYKSKTFFAQFSSLLRLFQVQSIFLNFHFSYWFTYYWWTSTNPSQSFHDQIELLKKWLRPSRSHSVPLYIQLNLSFYKKSCMIIYFRCINSEYTPPRKADCISNKFISKFNMF